MAKLITVTRAQEKAARTKMQKLVEKDAQFQAEKAEMEQFATAVKERRDAEHARKLAEEEGAEK